MKVLPYLGAVALVVAVTAGSHAADLESGIPVGGKIGTYSTTKCGGVEDGVAVGNTLCYT